MIFLTLVFRVLLDITFFVYLDKYHDYAGFEMDFNLTKYVISIVITLLLFALIPLRSSRVSEVVVQFFFISVYVPFASYFAFTNASYSWFLIFTGFWVIVFLMNQINFNWREIRSPIRYDSKYITLVITILTILVFGLIFMFSEVKFNLSFLDVYDIREENPTGSVPFSGYLINWTAKIFLPFLLIYSIIKKKRYFSIYSLLVMGAIVLLFTLTGHKSYVMVIPIIIGTIWLFRTGDFLLNLLISFSVLTIVGLILLLVFDHQIVLSLFVRRTLYVPAQLSFYYFDFFQNNHLLLSNSVFSSFFEYPYEMQPPKIIGEIYSHKPGISANNGIVSDGFANFGILGILIWAFLFSFILKIMDWLSNGKDPLILWTLILLGLMVFVGGSLLTGILTHGVILIILLTYLYPSKSKSN